MRHKSVVYSGLFTRVGGEFALDRGYMGVGGGGGGGGVVP